MYTRSLLLSNLFRFETRRYAGSTKQPKIMNKLMKGDRAKRKGWFPGVGQSQKDVSLPITQAISKGSKGHRRIIVLNKLFMKHITDLMSTGQYSNRIIGCGIEVSKVQVAADFNIVNVFWLAKGTENDDVIEKVLKSTAGFLRHELSGLRVIGTVPEIKFVKDKTFAKSAEVERMLQVADFGDDFEPVEYGEILKSEFALDFPSSRTVLGNQIESEGHDDEPLPEMRHDVFGLEHSEMMERIVTSCKKAKAPHRLSNLEEEEEDKVVSDNRSDKLDIEKFSKLLRKRTIMLEKKHKSYLDTRIEINHNYAVDNSEFEREEEKDYIEEVENEK